MPTAPGRDHEDSSANCLALEPSINTIATSANGIGRLKKHCVLIDYENVQPKNLSPLAGDRFHVLVFLGKNQSKITAANEAGVA